jgi:alpha-L-rhamnosidase
MKKKLSLALLFLISLFTSICIYSQPSAPTHLRCEYQENPIAIDCKIPRFSWAMSSFERGAVQGAYQILVSESEIDLGKDRGAFWDSKKLQSEESQFIEYKGKELQSMHRYYWKVRIWDRNDKPSAWSKVNWFETAIFNLFEWKATWIAPSFILSESPPRSIVMRKEFKLTKKIKSARIYVTGLGSYQLYINSKKISTDLLTPLWTDYHQKIQYQVYDIAESLKTGENAIAVLLGNMWWSSGLGWKADEVYSRGPLRLLAQLIIQNDDGTSLTIVSDKSWKFNESPIVYNHIYHGETYDARLEFNKWNEAGMNDKNWKNVVVIDNMKLRLIAQQDPPIRQSQEVVPVKITEPKPGVFVFDMGQNIVGWARLKVKGSKGDTIRLRFAELLYPDGTVTQENLRKAKATDTYILKGGDMEEWQPHFTYHGFQYIQVTGLAHKPDASTITGIVFYSAASATGSFSCSNELINSIYKNITWGQKGNMMSVPTDCPQRDERLGWMGDAQIFSPTASYNMNMNQFFAKWEQDIIDCQDSSGYVYDVNPAIVVDGPAKPGWGDAVVVIPWQMYTFYGDRRIIQNSYRGMLAWVDYMKKNSKNNIYEFGNTAWGGYGDWVAVDTSPTKPIGAAYYYYSSLLLSKMSAVLGDSSKSKTLLYQSRQIATAYQQKYFIDSLKNYRGLTQTANILPYYFGITPLTLKPRVLQNLVNNVHAKSDHLSTGFLGTAFLLPMLSENGYHELGYKIACQKTYPSWGYMVEKGATTMWELWNSDTERPDQMNSRNHFAYGSVGEWYYTTLAGINPDISKPGFKHSIIAPMPAGDLAWAKASLETGYGVLSSEWKRDENSLSLKVTIPANTTSTIKIPVSSSRNFEISESGKIIYNSHKGAVSIDHILFLLKDTDSINFAIDSGNYDFKVTYL